MEAQPGDTSKADLDLSYAVYIHIMLLLRDGRSNVITY